MKRPMIIGIDVDSCLADFNRAFTVVARTLYPSIPPCVTFTDWNLSVSLGITEEQLAKLWDHVNGLDWFWRHLPLVEMNIGVVPWLWGRVADGSARIYFITSRPESTSSSPVYVQTASWFQRRLPVFAAPSIIVEGDKGPLAKSLKLDLFYDDRWENCRDVKQWIPSCEVFMQDELYNLAHQKAARAMGIHIAQNMFGLVEYVGRSMAA